VKSVLSRIVPAEGFVDSCIVSAARATKGFSGAQRRGHRRMTHLVHLTIGGHSTPLNCGADETWRAKLAGYCADNGRV